MTAVDPKCCFFWISNRGIFYHHPLGPSRKYVFQFLWIWNAKFAHYYENGNLYFLFVFFTSNRFNIHKKNSISIYTAWNEFLESPYAENKMELFSFHLLEQEKLQIFLLRKRIKLFCSKKYEKLYVCISFESLYA